MIGSQWTINELNGDEVTSTHANTIPSGGVEFAFPSAGFNFGVASYALLMIDSFSVSLNSGNTLTAKIIVSTSDVTTQFFGNPNGGCYTLSSGIEGNPFFCPGFVRLFFESNLPGGGQKAFCTLPSNLSESNFWWSNNGIRATDAGTPGGYYVLNIGGSHSMTVTLRVPLQGSMWSDLCGKDGATNAAGFSQAIQTIKYIGLSFGSGDFFENGVGVDGSTGSATFQLTSYTIS